MCRKMINLKPIGIIHFPFRTKEEALFQEANQPDVEGSVEVLAELAPRLKDIETF